MTTTEEAVESIEHLDFTPPCDTKRGTQHEADYALACRGCGSSTLICERHLQQLRRALTRALRWGVPIQCTRCRRESRSFEDAAEVIPL